MKMLVWIFVFCCTVASGAGIEGETARRILRQHYIDQLKSDRLPPIVRASYVDSLNRLDPETHDLFLDEKMRALWQAGRYLEAVDIANRIVTIDDLTPSRHLNAVWYRAFSYHALGLYGKALDDIYEMITTPKPDSLDYYDVEAEYMMGSIYSLLGNSRMRLKCLEKARNKIAHLKCDIPHRDNLRMRWHLEKASAFMNSRDWIHALEQDSIAATFPLDSTNEAMIDFDKGVIYAEAGIPRLSEQHFKEFFRKTNENVLLRLQASSNYALFLLRQHRYREALEICRQTIPLTTVNRLEHVRGSLYNTMAKAYSALGIPDSAYSALEISTAIMDSVFEWRNSTTIAEVTRDFESRLARHERQQIVRASRKKGWIIAGLSLLVIALAVSGALFLRKWRRQQASGEALEERLRTSDSIHTAEIKEVKEVAGNDHRELLRLSMQVEQCNSLLREIQSLVSDNTSSPQGTIKAIKSMMAEYSSDIKNWEIFKLYFEKIHPGFFARLFRRHPDLSPGEVKMCAYILLNLSSKDIAQMSNRSPRTIDSIKYRLHKKLCPGIDVTTRSYLMTLLHSEEEE